MTGIKSYRDLEVWQRSMEVVVNVYQLTKTFPQSEIYGLTNQIRRSSVSIPSNIAEGHVRPTKDYARFLKIAMGSVAELETQIAIAKKLPFGKNINFSKVDKLLDEVMRMLNKLINQLK